MPIARTNGKGLLIQGQGDDLGFRCFLTGVILDLEEAVLILPTNKPINFKLLRVDAEEVAVMGGL